MRPGLFLIIGGHYLNTNVIASIQPYYQIPSPTGTPAGQTTGLTKGGLVRVWLDSRGVAGYPGTFAPLPPFLDITNKLEIAHARKLCTSWAETGIATHFTGSVALAHGGGGGDPDTIQGSAKASTPAKRPLTLETRRRMALAQKKRHQAALKLQQAGGATAPPATTAAKKKPAPKTMAATG